MEERIKTLHRKRGNLQVSITTFNKKLDKWRDNADERDPFLLKQNLAYLQSNFEKFDAIQDELEEFDQSESEHRESVQDNFNVAVARAKRYLHEVAISHDNESVKSHASSGQTQTQSTNSINANGIRLPRLSLPKFSGDISSWRTFLNLYNVGIHESSSLKQVEKFQYLLSVLGGGALILVKGLAVTDANYSVAYDLLCNRYDCERCHIFNHFHGLLDLPYLKHSSQISSFIAAHSVNIRKL